MSCLPVYLSLFMLMTFQFTQQTRHVPRYNGKTNMLLEQVDYAIGKEMEIEMDGFFSVWEPM
jgi:hypothetical protein